MKKHLSAILALCIALSLSACGGGSEKAGGSSEETVSAAAETTEKKTETEKATETTTEATTTEETTTETEPEPETDPSLYDYYNIIPKVHKSNGGIAVTYSRGYIGFDGKVIYSRYYGYDGNLRKYVNELYAYDIDTKKNETIRRFESEYDYLATVCLDNYIYIVTRTGNNEFNLEKIDSSGNTLASFEYNNKRDNPDAMEFYEMYYSLEDGSTIWNLTAKNNDNNSGFVMFSPDLKSYKFLPRTLEYKVEHGLTETKNISLYGFYNIGGKLYALKSKSGDPTKELVYLDEEKNMWLECTEDDLPKEEYLIYHNYRDNYTYYCDRIYDLSTGEQIADLSNRLRNTTAFFFCGDHDIVRYENQFYDVKLPIDGNIEWDKLTPMGTETKSLLFGIFDKNSTAYADSEYYLVVDDYGIFLRTFEKGEAEEETIAFFNQ